MIAELNRQTNMIKLSYRSDSDRETKFKIKIRTMGEFLMLYKSEANWFRKEGEEDLYAPYAGALQKAYDKIVQKRRKEYYTANIDMTKKFAIPQGYTWKMVCRPRAGYIHVALVKRSDVVSQYCVCLSQQQRDQVVREIQQAPEYDHRFTIDRKVNPELFKRWEGFVQAEYIKTYLREMLK